MRRASEAEKARLGETFAALCRIPSPFGHERAAADHVIRELRRLGIDVTEDGAAEAAGAECGNLHARIAGRGERTVLLCAHLDTVSVTGPIEPVVVDGGWENEHDAILGADNKAAVAVLLELARRVRVEGSPVGIELLFTVSEENALAGAKQVERSAFTAEFGYVFDHATPIGELVVASPTYYRIAADYHGKAAHAGIRPEAGRSAIVAAAHAVSAMPLGRLDEETTANVGSIHGGAGSTNVVAERCRLLAETRSLDPEKAETAVARIVDALNDGAAAAECDVDIVTERLFTGYRQKPSAPAVVAAEAALRACGYEPRRIATGGGSDANALEAIGLPCVNLANGTERNHEPTERVSVAALEGMLDVALALLDEAAAVYSITAVSSQFEQVTAEIVHEGKFIALERRIYRHEDGAEVEREIVSHPGAVGVVVLDGDDLWLVRQPREAVGAPDLLELPAGKLDEEGESPLETARRELAEEIGKQAEHWEDLGSFYTSPGFTDEEVFLYVATGISDVSDRPEVEEDERIHVEVRPLADLDAILEETKDAKTLIGLMKLRERLRG